MRRENGAARVRHYFNKGDAHWPELHAPQRTLRVDSKVLDKAEIGETATSDKDYEARLKDIVEAADLPETRKPPLLAMRKEELLREIVDNVGKRGTAGQDLQNVISVAMLYPDPQNKATREALHEWVRAINEAGGFGRGSWDVAFKPGEVQDIITKHAAVAELTV